MLLQSSADGGVPIQFKAWISGTAKSPAGTYPKIKDPGDVVSCLIARKGG
jgi:hypothetical protein